MNAVRVKICGLTRVEDVARAVDCGADYVGFVFAASPRQLDVRTARMLLEAVSGPVAKVALFMNQPASEVTRIVSSLAFDLLQFHGRESNEYCKQFGLPFLKAVPMADADSAKASLGAFPDADGLLLDSHDADSAGGSGKVFDWSAVPSSEQKIWLAGGLHPLNVGAAIERVGPWAVDVSSGVEQAPGIKDHALLEAFIDAARAARSH